MKLTFSACQGARCIRLGTATVEFAMTLPILLSVILAVWELGRMVEVQQIISNAAREGGREATTGNLTNAQVVTAVRDYIKRAGLPAAAANNATITVNDLTTPGTDATVAAQMDHFQITISLNYVDVRFTSLNLIATPSTTLNAAADWYSMNDLPLNVNAIIPVN